MTTLKATVKTRKQGFEGLLTVIENGKKLYSVPCKTIRIKDYDALTDAEEQAQDWIDMSKGVDAIIKSQSL